MSCARSGWKGNEHEDGVMRSVFGELVIGSWRRR